MHYIQFECFVQHFVDTGSSHFISAEQPKGGRRDHAYRYTQLRRPLDRTMPLPSDGQYLKYMYLKYYLKYIEIFCICILNTFLREYFREYFKYIWSN